MVPELLLPIAIVVFEFGVLETTAEVPIGLLVVHVKVTLHVLAPDAMVQDEGDDASVPDGATADEASAAEATVKQTAATATTRLDERATVLASA